MLFTTVAVRKPVVKLRYERNTGKGVGSME
jgi:hypothetical protein